MTKKHHLLFDINYLFKWLVICVLLSLLIGSVTAFFLHSLEYVTALRLKYTWLIFTLPIIGGVTGWIYTRWGEGSIKGNNLLLEEHKKPEQAIPFKMAPMILFTTIISHVSGASVGREGTAVQMGGAISDQFTKWFSLNNEERKTIIIAGISAGFSAVFGTPFAGALFALEIMGYNNIRWQSIIPSFIATFAANFICLWWNVNHVDYHFDVNWIWNLKNVLLIIASGVFFGITAMLFSNANKLFKPLTVAIPNLWIKGVVGGAAILLLYLCFPMSDYMGLGITGITNAFSQITPWYVFLIKLFLTVFTISVGFKGGEVTPLFFIGATMSSFLILFIPLPLSILAAMGLVAVFAGATHTLIASIALGYELFGTTVGSIVVLAVIVAYFTSGEQGIYASQEKTGAKYTLYNYIKEVIKL